MMGISLWQGLLTGCQSDASGAEIKSLKTQPIFVKSEDVRCNYTGTSFRQGQGTVDKLMTGVKGATLSFYVVTTQDQQCFTPNNTLFTQCPTNVASTLLLHARVGNRTKGSRFADSCTVLFCVQAISALSFSNPGSLRFWCQGNQDLSGGLKFQDLKRRKRQNQQQVVRVCSGSLIQKQLMYLTLIPNFFQLVKLAKKDGSNTSILCTRPCSNVWTTVGLWFNFLAPFTSTQKFRPF